MSLFTIKVSNGTNDTFRKVSWNNLLKSIDYLNNTIKFSRTAKIQEKYDRYLSEVKKEEMSIFDRMMNTEIIIDGVNSFGVDNEFVFRKNRFPYNFGTHEHWVLWLHPNCSEKTKSIIFDQGKSATLITDIVISFLGREEIFDKENKKPFIMFRNAPFNKSIPCIEHFHVILKLS